jgi:hypothetical protein
MSEVGRSVRAMADPVGIISLVLTPTVVAGYSLVQKRYELQRTDLQELRTVLDNASERLAFASRALEGWAALTRRAVKHPDGPEAIEVRRAQPTLQPGLARRSTVSASEPVEGRTSTSPTTTRLCTRSRATATHWSRPSRPGAARSQRGSADAQCRLHRSEGVHRFGDRSCRDDPRSPNQRRRYGRRHRARPPRRGSSLLMGAVTTSCYPIATWGSREPPC